MKSNLLIIIVAAWFFSGNVCAQDQDNINLSFGARFNIGYSGFDLTGIRNNYNDVVKGYDLIFNIPVHTQKEFPANGIYSADVFIDLNNKFRINMGYSAYNTKAYALYGDYAGEVDVIGDIKTASIYLGGALILPKVYFITPYVEANIGYFYGSYVIESAVRIPESGVNQTEKIDLNGNRWMAEPAMGFFYKIYSIEVHVKGGYRYAIIDKLSGEYWNSFSQYYPLSGDKLKIDMSGFFIMSGISFTLN